MFNNPVIQTMVYYRILELGFGKEIEEILDILGSRKNGSDGNALAKASEFQRQNLLLSATLNEKVNHLAKISLENPVMIGLGDKKMQPAHSLENSESAESDLDDASENPCENVSSSMGDFKLPSQLVQRYVKGKSLLLILLNYAFHTLLVPDQEFFAVPCGSRLVVLLSILKHLYERCPSQKVRLESYFERTNYNHNH